MTHEGIIARTSADLCRTKGWIVGTILEGDEGYGPERIIITAIGEEQVLARRLDGAGDEHLWNLRWRDWQEYSAEPSGENHALK